MTNILFSIIIPAYNAEKYLNECIESLLHQTYKDFEIIIVDDGSTDSTPQICNNLKQLYSSLKIKVIRQANQRQVAARMNGIDHAEGEYCIFLDADDKLVNTALVEIYKAIEKYKADIIIYNGDRFCEDNKVAFWPHYRETETFFEGKDYLELKRDTLRSNRFNNVWNKAYKREVIVNSNRFTDVSFMTIEEDYMMQLPWLDTANNAVYLPRNLYLYRFNTESITFQKFDRYKFKSALYLFDVESQYANKWTLQNGDFIIDQKFLNRVSASVKQFYNNSGGFTFTQKRKYLQSISENSTFRTVYKKFKGKLNSKVGQIILFFIYHKLLCVALFLAEHDPKVHGTKMELNFK